MRNCKENTKRQLGNLLKGSVEYFSSGLKHCPSHVDFGTPRTMTEIVHTCAIIHNVVVGHRDHKYSGTRNVLFDEDEMQVPTGISRVTAPTSQ